MGSATISPAYKSYFYSENVPYHLLFCCSVSYGLCWVFQTEMIFRQTTIMSGTNIGEDIRHGATQFLILQALLHLVWYTQIANKCLRLGTRIFLLILCSKGYRTYLALCLTYQSVFEFLFFSDVPLYRTD